MVSLNEMSFTKKKDKCIGFFVCFNIFKLECKDEELKQFSKCF